jgi:hypothetical protein
VGRAAMWAVPVTIAVVLLLMLGWFVVLALTTGS